MHDIVANSAAVPVTLMEWGAVVHTSRIHHCKRFAVHVVKLYNYSNTINSYVYLIRSYQLYWDNT